MKHNGSILQRFFSAISRYRILTLILILLVTSYFGYQMRNLSISADYSALLAVAPPTEFVPTPIAGESNSSIVRPSSTPQQTVVIQREEVLKAPIEATTDIADNSVATKASSDASASTPQGAILDTPEIHAEFGDGLAILVHSENPFNPDLMTTIYNTKQILEAQPDIGPCLSPFDFVTVEKKGTRLAIIPMSPHSNDLPWTEQEVQILRNRMLNDDIAKNYLYSEDGKTILIYYQMQGGLPSDRLNELVSYLDPLKEQADVHVIGGGFINDRVMYYLNKDLFTLLILCFMIILITCYLSFRSIRAVFMPFSLAILGIVWVLGTMVKLHYQLSLITILTPCLVLVLGSSYSIHMISEYYGAYNGDKTDKTHVYQAEAKIAKTIVFACLTTVVGFLSMLFSDSPAFREFGITVSIGILYCVILSLTYLPAVLSLVPAPKQRQMDIYKQGLLIKSVRILSRTVPKYWYVFLLIMLLIFCGFLFVKDRIEFNSNYMSYFPQDDPLVQDSVFFARTLGGTDPYYFTINAPDNEKNFFLQPENLQKVYTFEEMVLQDCKDIVQILSLSQYVSFLNKVYNGESGIPDSPALINLLSRTLRLVNAQIGANVLEVLMNEDASQITLSMRNFDSVEQDLQTNASAKRIEETLDTYRYLLPAGTSSRIWCFASDNLHGSEILMHDQNVSTWLSFIFVFILVIIAFRSFKLGICSLVPILVGVMGNYIFMWIFHISFDIVTIGFSSITIGVGIDDAIHFILRYRNNEKLNKDMKIEKLLSKTIEETGRPIILTTISIVSGMLMLLFASYTPIQYFGLLMSFALIITTLSTLFILPSVLILLDKTKRFLRNHRKQSTRC